MADRQQAYFPAKILFNHAIVPGCGPVAMSTNGGHALVGLPVGVDKN